VLVAADNRVRNAFAGHRACLTIAKRVISIVNSGWFE
jgi:hypothetical protein